MTIASDRWIRDQCVGQPCYELYYDDVRQKPPAGQGRAGGLFTLDFFSRNEQLSEALRLLNPGESHIDNTTTGTTMTFKCVADAPAKPLIAPFIASSVKHLEFPGETIHAVTKLKCPSYGSSSYGYDIRPANRWKRMRQVQGGIVSTIAEPDCLHPDDYSEDIEAPYIDIPSMGCVLGVSMERICMPDNVTAVCMAKSTLARLFLEAAVTPLEAGWSGYITLEFFNKSPNTIRLWAGIGAMQLVFHVSNERCLVSYEDRGGKYQDQPAVPVAGTF